MADGTLFPDAVDEAPPGTWTVAELSAHVARTMAGAFPTDLWVEGQIRDLSRSATGHVYFQLAEPTEGGRPPRTQVAVTLLGPERQLVNQQLKRAGGAIRMDDGVEVRIQGRLRWYAPRGILQLRMHGIDPTFTLGRLQADRDRILAALVADGLLDANAAHPLPLVPLRVALVTSRGSAAHADVLAELAASGIGFQVRSVDARTQGADCSASLVRALTSLTDADVDVVLLVRGGGARTDLAGFDTDAVARAIAAMGVPVLTGIGHEIDRSIADEVAHTAHKTPTAAAAHLVQTVQAFLARVDHHAVGVHRAGASAAVHASARLDRRVERLGRAAERSLSRRRTGLGQTATRLAGAGSRVLDRAEDNINAGELTLGPRARRHLDHAERDLSSIEAHVRAHDPALAMARGWTVTLTADGRLARRAADLAPGDALVTRLLDGSVTSVVTDRTVFDTADTANTPANTPADSATDLHPPEPSSRPQP